MERLREALRKHPAIAFELVNIFGCAPPECSAIKFLIKSPTGEQLRWEALQSDAPARFLALSDVCPISRVTSARMGPGPRKFDFPLRMAAFLSASGIPAGKEEEKICGQILAARANGLPVECTFYLSEQQLLDDLQKEIADGRLKDSGVTVEPIPPTAFEITECLKKTAFQFLHFFCHGIERAGVRGLSLATINDYDKNEANKNTAAASIFLSLNALSDTLAHKSSIWITVFNSCSSAQPMLETDYMRELHSIALEVAKKGCPYTIGMAEPIDGKDATAFSEAFYGELFAIVTRTLRTGQAITPLILDLSPAMIPARKVIYDRWSSGPPEAFGRWLRPLLYQSSQQSLMVVQSADLSMWRRLQQIARTLQIMPPDTPVELRNQLLALLDKEPIVPKELRPNCYGAFVKVNHD